MWRSTTIEQPVAKALITQPLTVAGRSVVCWKELWPGTQDVLPCPLHLCMCFLGKSVRPQPHSLLVYSEVNSGDLGFQVIEKFRRIRNAKVLAKCQVFLTYADNHEGKSGHFLCKQLSHCLPDILPKMAEHQGSPWWMLLLAE